MIAQELYDLLKTTFGDAILEAKLDGVIDPWVSVAPDRILDVARFLRDDERTQFDLLTLLSGVDMTKGTLAAVYHLFSMKRNHKIVLKTFVGETHPHVQSLASVWRTADWQEREAYDMFGIIFDGHPDLRRILMPDDWDGHPLRKDYEVPEFYNGMKVPY
jgi:NADH-quinone oxidoreductase subunit C